MLTPTPICSAVVPPAAASYWSAARKGQILEVAYGVGSDFPQYAALHTESSFLRLNYGKQSGWGTSIVLLPSFWSDNRYHQGALITTRLHHDGTVLEISFAGSISTLRVEGQILLSPPAAAMLSGTVRINVDGDIQLERRLYESFKPVVLSSMHLSAREWDAASVQVEGRIFQMPVRGWIIGPPIIGKMFALIGGTSDSKDNAPTLEIALPEKHLITGWKTESSNSDDDNIGLWVATEEVVRHWEYTFRVTP
jgi:hypothetical protein